LGGCASHNLEGPVPSPRAPTRARDRHRAWGFMMPRANAHVGNAAPAAAAVIGRSVGGISRILTDVTRPPDAASVPTHDISPSLIPLQIYTECAKNPGLLWSAISVTISWSKESKNIVTKGTVLILILYCVIPILILYCTTLYYYYVLFHWRCMYVWYVLLNSTYLGLLT